MILLRGSRPDTPDLPVAIKISRTDPSCPFSGLEDCTRRNKGVALHWENRHRGKRDPQTKRRPRLWLARPFC